MDVRLLTGSHRVHQGAGPAEGNRVGHGVFHQPRSGEVGSGLPYYRTAIRRADQAQTAAVQRPHEGTGSRTRVR